MPSPTEMLSEIQSTLQTLPERMGNVLSDQQLPAPSYEVNPSVTPASQAGNAGRASGGSMTPDMPATFPNLPPLPMPNQMASFSQLPAVSMSAQTPATFPNEASMPAQTPPALPASSTLPSVDMQEIRASGIGASGASEGPAGIFSNVLAQSERSQGEDPARKMIDLLEEIVEGLDELTQAQSRHVSSWGQTGSFGNSPMMGNNMSIEVGERDIGIAAPSFRGDAG